MYYCSNCGVSVSGAGTCHNCGVMLVGGKSGSEASKKALRRSYLKEHSVLYNIWLGICGLFRISFGIAGIAIFLGGAVLVFYNPPFADFEDVFSRLVTAAFIMAAGWALGKRLFRKRSK